MLRPAGRHRVTAEARSLQAEAALATQEVPGAVEAVRQSQWVRFGISKANVDAFRLAEERATQPGPGYDYQ